MAKRRNKPRVAWLPHTDANTLPIPGTSDFSNVIRFALDAGGPVGNIVTGVVPIVIDAEQDPLEGTTSLADIEDSGYRLRRIVGKCFVSYAQDADDVPGAVLVGGAFIILRVDNVGVPLAATAGLAGLVHYDLFNIRNDDSPWIWRREWALQNRLKGSPLFDYPTTSAGAASAYDGPHIDQKTARVVMSDERLFFVASAMVLDPGDAQLVNPVNFVLTTRVLASMKTTLGNRRNASR